MAVTHAMHLTVDIVTIPKHSARSMLETSQQAQHTTKGTTNLANHYGGMPEEAKPHDDSTRFPPPPIASYFRIFSDSQLLELLLLRPNGNPPVSSSKGKAWKAWKSCRAPFHPGLSGFRHQHRNQCYPPPPSLLHHPTPPANSRIATPVLHLRAID